MAREAYREFWQVHPAAAVRSDVIGDHVGYDLSAANPSCTPARPALTATEATA
ncbi:hypothetical protein OCAE111667_23100 [Occultella aeris]|uniref:Uncharacterized protein n=1 Tax=Occultella aeris TaxID=2761496 RepID=A0A7M4DLA8_9MICO|nr:hypothetical protein [Occultella aeris]VZO38040.1 hypothetical protein HALOF300_02925 [Occultella aeris]